MGDFTLPGAVAEPMRLATCSRRTSIPFDQHQTDLGQKKRRGSLPIDFKCILTALKHESSPVLLNGTRSHSVTEKTCEDKQSTEDVKQLDGATEKQAVSGDDQDLLDQYTRDLAKMENAIKQDRSRGRHCSGSSAQQMPTRNALLAPVTRERRHSCCNESAFSSDQEEQLDIQPRSRPRANTVSGFEHVPRPPSTPRRLSVESCSSSSSRVGLLHRRRRLSTNSTCSEGYNTWSGGLPSPEPADDTVALAPARPRAATFSGSQKKYVPVGLRRKSVCQQRAPDCILQPPSIDLREDQPSVDEADPDDIVPSRRRHTISFTEEVKLLAKKAGSVFKVSDSGNRLTGNGLLKNDTKGLHYDASPINPTVEPIYSAALTGGKNYGICKESLVESIKASKADDKLASTNLAGEVSQSTPTGYRPNYFSSVITSSNEAIDTCNRNIEYFQPAETLQRHNCANISCLRHAVRDPISADQTKSPLASTSDLSDSDTDPCDCHRHCISISIVDRSMPNATKDLHRAISTSPTLAVVQSESPKVEQGQDIDCFDGGYDNKKDECIVGAEFDSNYVDSPPKESAGGGGISNGQTLPVEDSSAGGLKLGPVMDYHGSHTGDNFPQVPSYWVKNQCTPSVNNESVNAGLQRRCLVKESLMDLVRRSSVGAGTDVCVGETEAKHSERASGSGGEAMVETAVPSLDISMAGDTLDKDEAELSSDSDFVSSDPDCTRLFTPRAGDENLLPFDRLLREADMLLPAMAKTTPGALQEELKLWDLEADISLGGDDDDDDDTSSLCMTARDVTSELADDFTMRSGALSRMDAATRLELELGIQLHDSSSKTRQIVPTPDLPERVSGAAARLQMANQHATGALSEEEIEEAEVTLGKFPEGGQNSTETTKAAVTSEASDDNGNRVPKNDDSHSHQSAGDTVATTSHNQRQTQSADECIRQAENIAHNRAASESQSSDSNLVVIKDDGCVCARPQINGSMSLLDNTGDPMTSTLAPSPALGSHVHIPTLKNKPSLDNINHTGLRSKLKDQLTAGLSHTLLVKHNVDCGASTFESLTRDWRITPGGAMREPCPPHPDIPPLPSPGRPVPVGGISPSDDQSSKHPHIDSINKRESIDWPKPADIQVKPTVNTGPGSHKVNSGGGVHTQKHTLSLGDNQGREKGKHASGDKNISRSLNEAALRRYTLSQGKLSPKDSRTVLGGVKCDKFVPSPPRDAPKMTVSGMETAKTPTRPKSSKGRSRVSTSVGQWGEDHKGAGAGVVVEDPATDTRMNRPQSAWRSQYKRPQFTAEDDSSDEGDSDVEVVDLDCLSPPSSPMFDIPGTNAEPMSGDDVFNRNGGEQLHSNTTITTISGTRGQAKEPVVVSVGRELDHYMKSHMPDDLTDDPPYHPKNNRKKHGYMDSDSLEPNEGPVYSVPDSLLPEVIYGKAAERVVEKYRRRAMTDSRDARSIRHSSVDKLTSGQQDVMQAPRKLKPILHRRSTSKDQITEAMSRVACDEANLPRTVAPSHLDYKSVRRSSTPDIYRNGTDVNDIVNASVHTPYNKLAPLRKQDKDDTYRTSDRDERTGKGSDKATKQRLQPLPIQKESPLRGSSSSGGASPSEKGSPKTTSRSIVGTGEEARISDINTFEASLDAELRNVGVPSQRHGGMRKNSTGSITYSPMSGSPSPRAGSPTRRLGPSPRNTHKHLQKTQSGGAPVDQKTPSLSPSRKHTRNLSDSNIVATTSSTNNTRRNLREYEASPRPVSRAGRTEARGADLSRRHNDIPVVTPSTNVQRTPRSVEESPRSNTPNSGRQWGEQTSPGPGHRDLNPPPSTFSSAADLNRFKSGRGSSMPAGKPPAAPVPLGKSLGSSGFKMRQGEMMAQMMAELGGDADFRSYHTSGRHRDDDI